MLLVTTRGSFGLAEQEKKNFRASTLIRVKPDLMGWQSFGGGILPVSFVAGSKDVMNLLTPGSEGSTFEDTLASVGGHYQPLRVLLTKSL